MRTASVHGVTRCGLAAIGLGCFGIFLVVVYRWVREPGRSFDGVTGMVLGLAVPLALGAFFVASSRWSRSRQLRLVAALGITILVVYGFELHLARKRIDGRELAATAARFNAPFDTRTHAEVVVALRALGVPAVLNFRPKHMLRAEPDGALRSVIRINGAEILPMGGIPNRLTVWCNEGGTYRFYTSDAHGFHNPPHVWQSARTDIVVLGNSFALGACVPAGDSFVDRIRRVHPATVNLGMGHHGPLLQLGTLTEYVRPARPRMVLWIYEEDHDLPFLRDERRSPLLMRYLQGAWSQGLRSRPAGMDQAVLDESERELQLQLRKLKDAAADGPLRRLTDSVKLRHVRGRLGLTVWKGTADTVDSGSLELFRGILGQARDATASWGGTLIFVYLPAHARYAGEPSPPGRARDIVLDLVARLRIPVIDAHTVFQAHGDPLSLFPFRQDGHYTEQGHALVAREILRCIALPDFARNAAVCPSSTSTSMR